MVVVRFVIGGVWHGVAVVVVIAMFSGGWGGGSNRGRRWLLVVYVTEWMWVVARMVVVQKEKVLFVHDVYVIVSANAAYAAQYKGRMVAYMIYYVKSL